MQQELPGIFSKQNKASGLNASVLTAKTSVRVAMKA
jgi:hypothetical protein